jgi:hypothetical protein
MLHRALEQPSQKELRIWKAAKALGWSPFDERLLNLTTPQLDWAILMEDPERREAWRDSQFTDRDIKAVELLEWYRNHVTG